jgi:hypothetical protein
MTIDKFYHFVAGTCVLVLANIAGFSDTHSVGFVLGAALGKELYDKFIKHSKIDFVDMLATCLPTIAIFIRMVH